VPLAADAVVDRFVRTNAGVRSTRSRKVSPPSDVGAMKSPPFLI